MIRATHQIEQVIPEITVEVRVKYIQSPSTKLPYPIENKLGWPSSEVRGKTALVISVSAVILTE